MPKQPRLKPHLLRVGDLVQISGETYQLVERMTRAPWPREKVISSNGERYEVAAHLTYALESTDPRGIGAAKLQRLSDGSTRILLLGQMGTPATHGYRVGAMLRFGKSNVCRLNVEHGHYIVPAADWAALEAAVEAA
jgi:hypothetical protein